MAIVGGKPLVRFYALRRQKRTRKSDDQGLAGEVKSCLLVSFPGHFVSSFNHLLHPPHRPERIVWGSNRLLRLMFTSDLNPLGVGLHKGPST